MTDSNANGAVDLGELGPGGIKRGTSPFIKFLKKLRPYLNETLTPYSLVGNAALSRSELFPWIAELLEQMPAIRAEADAIMRHHEAIPPFRDFAPGHERIVGENDWRCSFSGATAIRCQKTSLAAPTQRERWRRFRGW